MRIRRLPAIVVVLVLTLATACGASRARQWFEAGRAAEFEGRSSEAVAMYRRALAESPDDIEYRVALALAEEALRRASVAPIHSPSGPGEAPRTSDRLDAIPVDLRFVDASLQEIFRTLGELAEVEILFDDAYRDVRVSVDLRGVSVKDALFLLASTHRLFLKVVP